MYAIETGGGSYKTSSLSYSQSTYLSKGSTGEAVKQTQQILSKLGYNTGGADGIFGKNTDAAIRNFQKANGLTPDGIIGPKTLQALKQAANTTNYTASYASSASTTPKTYTAQVNLRPVTTNSGSVTPAIQKSSNIFTTTQNNTYIKAASASTTPTYSTNINAKPSYSSSSAAPMPNKPATAAANTNTAYMAYHSTGSTTLVYTGGSTSPSYIKNGSTTPYITAGGSSTPMIYNKSGSTTPLYTGGSITPQYIAGGSTVPKPYYTGASTTPIIYSKSGSTTPITGGSTTSKLNIIVGQLNGSTTPQNYKVYDKNGQITTNQQNVNAVTVIKNFGEGIGNAAVDTAKGLWKAATHPAETVQGIAYAATHPAEAANAIKNEAIKTYNDFKTGDANTKAKILGDITGEVALSLAGTKGVDKVAKAVKEAGVIARTAEAADVANAGKAAGVAEKTVVTAVKGVTTQTAEKTTFKELRDVVKFLKENGINDHNDRRDIVKAFNPGTKVVELEKDFKAYRYFGGKSKPRGKWLTDKLLKDPANELALPPVNTTEKVQEWIIPKGTKVLDGTVAPHENWGRPGGARQIFVPNPEVLKEGKNIWSLRGTSYMK